MSGQHGGGLRATGGPGVPPERQSVPPGQHGGGLRGVVPPGQQGGGQDAEPAGERQVPFYCPYCGDEDLRPAGPAGGSWRCGACARAFELRFAGVSAGEAGAPAGGGPPS